MPEITMPKMGDAMEEGTLLEWLKKEGEPVEEQEPIATIETEKSTIEIPSFYAGQLKQILVQPGDTVPVGTPIAVIETGDGSETADAAPATADQAPTGRADGPPPAASRVGPSATEGGGAATRRRGEDRPPASSPSRPVGQGSQRRVGSSASEGSPQTRVRASPLARKVAAQRGVDLTRLHGTGPGGRIVEADVDEYLRTQEVPALPGQAPPRAPEREPTTLARPGEVATEPARPAAPPRPLPAKAARPLAETGVTERELSAIRRTIARRLVESKQQIPHYYVTSAIAMDAVARLRDQINALRGEAPKISYNDFIVRACALALKQFPTVNAQFAEGRLRQFEAAHVGVAVALPEGLIVPVLRDADRKSVSQINEEVRALAERARNGQLKPEEYSGGTFTISNLGMFDVEQFAGIINPPEVALLAVGAITEEPVVCDGRVSPGLRMRATLSADHRIVDGAVAAQFLQAVKKLLQEPLLLI